MRTQRRGGDLRAAAADGYGSRRLYAVVVAALGRVLVRFLVVIGGCG